MHKPAVKLDWTEVDSSNVDAVAHDPRTKTLCVKFKSGGLYSYMNADVEVFVDLIHAESVGKYLNNVVKVNHPYARYSSEEELIKHLSL